MLHLPAELIFASQLLLELPEIPIYFRAGRVFVKRDKLDIQKL